MTLSLILLIFLGPFLAIAPAVAAAAPQIPGFFGAQSRPRPWRPSPTYPRPARAAVRFA